MYWYVCVMLVCVASIGCQKDFEIYKCIYTIRFFMGIPPLTHLRPLLYPIIKQDFGMIRFGDMYRVNDSSGQILLNEISSIRFGKYDF